MRPRLRARMLGTVRCASRKGARRLTASAASKSSTPIASSCFGTPTPALLTSTPIGPSRFSTSSTRRSGPSGSDRSKPWIRACDGNRPGQRRCSRHRCRSRPGTAGCRARCGRGGVHTRCGRRRGPGNRRSARRHLSPRHLGLNAGAHPLLRPLHKYSWETFSSNWEVDVRHVFNWTREALLAPLDPGSVVVTVSSGAALQGSSIGGSYSGAKATILFMTGFAAEESDREKLGIRFVSALPGLNAGTALGHAAATAHAQREGV